LSLSPDPLAPHGDGFFTWHAYEPACKAELWSTGFTDSHGTTLFDPINWPEPSPQPPAPVLIVKTNANHDRACADLAKKWQAILTDRPPGFTSIPIPGAGEAESAFFHRPSGSLVLGDALIHLAPHGLMLLPDKYCTNPALLRKSLGKLLDFPVRRIFFAHGDPILQNGRERIQSLLP
jgi:glyoxylase-like metal-dependent hydrolase (beta-lactamase superfamily II)